MKAVFEYVETRSDTIFTFWFRPEKPVKNVSGQFTELYLPHSNPDTRGQKRWFTIYSSPTEELFAITTKIVEKSSTFKQNLRRILPGTTLEFAEPMGDFILPKDKALPLVFVAGGIGITPFRSITKWLADTNEHRTIHLLYAANTANELIDQELFDNVLTKTNYIISQPSKEWTGLTGHLTADRILELINLGQRPHVYMSGPEPMVEALTKNLIAEGLPKNQVITDYFPGYTAF